MTKDQRQIIEAISRRVKRFGRPSVTTIEVARESGFTNAQTRHLLRGLEADGHVQRILRGLSNWWCVLHPETPAVEHCRTRRYDTVLPVRYTFGAAYLRKQRTGSLKV